MAEPTTQLDYVQAYSEFQAQYKIAQVSAEEVGVLVMKMAGYLMRYNLVYGEALRRFAAVKATIINTVDTQTGKAISATKADTLADATPESNDYQMAKVHVTNCSEATNALKSLQKSLQVEYNNS